jgi:urea carboxylase
MFRKVLVANRGAIACRIMRTLGNMGIGSVAVYSEADRHSLHVQQADEALLIGPPPAAQSYLSMGAILEAAGKSGAEAIHPGYGFLSENADFAQVCADSGLAFIGPTPEQMRVFGLKHTARAMARECGVPLLPGTGLLAGAREAVEEAYQIGYPVMLKSTAGGGGIGMRLCRSPEELLESYEAVEALSRASFGNSELFIEKFVTSARHIEAQIFGDGSGTVIALGERDCSPQRRNQKVIEETPAPGLRQSLREKMFAAAVQLGAAVRYQSAGTVEFIYDNKTEDFYFLEVNTRLQVEHGVTEEVTGIDLVEWMIQQAAGELPELSQQRIRPAGCSIQVRVYAENPAKNFQPSSGRLSSVAWPIHARVETWVEAGTEVTPFYDPMLAKILVRGENRSAALAHLRCALKHCTIAGIETNLSYVRQVAADPGFEAGGITTSFLEAFEYQRSAIDVIEPGTQTTVQDYPGRAGYWHVGVPPSGPMDALAFRIANRLVDNLDSVAGLEIAVTGPTLRFASDVVIALTGADFGARLDGMRVPMWRSLRVSAGSTLEMTTAQGPGSRAYLAVSGGLDVPEYLESRSTFILGGFGGHAGRVLRSGDVVGITENGPAICCERKAPSELIPRYATEWEIGVLYGPHGAPDFFTFEDIEMFFSTAWKVHHHSDRTGIRLIGPKPLWARPDGGEAGLHPSNIHDNAYAIGTVDFTGDMPVILGPDGPSLGGFVCPATIVQAELWKMGQLKPGDLVRFRAISRSQAAEMEEQMEACIAELTGRPPALPEVEVREEAVLARRPESGEGSPAIVCRADGDRHLLIEYGPNVLDLNLRARVHALEERLRAAILPGILDITPGVRSLQVHYDGRVLRREHLLEALQACEEQIPDLDNLVLPSRIVHLPLSWDDPATRLAIAKYMQLVRPDTPWCPSNIEFIRRINGLNSVDEVHRIVFDASYLVLGLGDVYLGAPVATPIDPRHRLVTTKYNPARTWTPENAVGIGGAYLCVYGMEGPGGYQFVGRTLQMWNTFHTTAEFQPGTPWLLRCFDQIRFFPVTADELVEIRDAFPHGQYSIRMEDQQFRMLEYHKFLGSIADSAADFKRCQQEAFLAERERWALAGADQFAEPPDAGGFTAGSDPPMPEGCRAVRSPTTASVWKVAVEPGQRVIAGEKLIVLEAMKMEIAVAAPIAGVIEGLNCAKGAMVLAGQNLVTLRQEVAS